MKAADIQALRQEFEWEALRIVEERGAPESSLRGWYLRLVIEAIEQERRPFIALLVQIKSMATPAYVFTPEGSLTKTDDGLSPTAQASVASINEALERINEKYRPLF